MAIARKIIWTIGGVGGESLTVTMTTTQGVMAYIATVDAKGKSVPVDGIPVWISSNPSALVVSPVADGYSALIAATGVVGSFEVRVTVDANPGSPVDTIAGVLEVDVVASKATDIIFTVGDPY